MPVVNYVKNGFSNIRALVSSIVGDMTSTTNGHEYFKLVFPTTAYTSGQQVFQPKNGGFYPDANVVILESRIASDPLANIDVSVTNSGSINAAWRLGFVLHNENILTVHAGTRLNLPGKETNPLAPRGNLVFLTNRATKADALEFREPAGCMNIKSWSNYTNTNNIFGKVPKSVVGSTSDVQLPAPDYTKPDEVFISRVTSVGAETAYPMNYALTMTNRGVVLVVWEDNQEEIPEGSLPENGYGAFNGNVDITYGNSPLRWFAIQRAVDRETGKVRGSYATRSGLPFFNTGGYGATVTIAVTPPGTAVTGATLVAGGQYYSVGDIVNIAGGGGKGATFTVDTVNTTTGAILTLTLASGGSGYAAALAVATSTQPSGLTLNITAVGGIVTVATVASGGAFYPVGLTVTILGGAFNATVTVDTINPVTGEVLTLIGLIGGSGYTTLAGAATTFTPIPKFANETSRCPVFCVFGTGVPNSYRKFIVREIDSLVPSPKRPATYNTEDSPAILNPLPQQSVTEQGEFVVTFLNNLSTSRFRYGDEMDLIGTVGAEVAGAGTSITVKVYQDTYTRTYRAMFTNKQYGKGMRIMMLTAANDADEQTNTGVNYTGTIINNPIY